ncbi:MAG: carbohydrate kinase family protein [Lentimicrobium sp.]|nr:carbohydrate kinase family protein [Lentimicrobium sp.]
MKKYDVVAIGELNVDLILNGIKGSVEIGKEIFANDMLLTLGSSTAIFAANVSSLGSKTAFVGMIGKDSFGQLVKDSLVSKGVSTDFIIETEKYATGVTVGMSYGEERAMVTYQGPMDVMTFDDIDKSVFEQTKHIHISSVFFQAGLKHDLVKILKYATEKGITTSLDVQWDPSEKWDFDYNAILPYVTVFMPNETEITLLTHSESLDEAIEKVKPLINICVIKQGNKGSILLQKGSESVFLTSFLNTQVVDAIGAGDSFNSGFIYQFVKGGSPKECQRFGNLMGAINTTSAGGTGAFASKEAVVQLAQEKFSQTITL